MPRGARNSRRNRTVATTNDEPKNPPGLRFTRRARIPDKAAFDRVFTKASRSRDRWFTVLYSVNGERRARLGLAISRKHCRLAAQRNRLKRIVRESFRHHQQELAGLDIVVMNGRDAQTAANRQLFDSLAAHWQRCRRKAPRRTRDGQ